MSDQRAMRLLENLTPGGSEYFEDPERCAQWVETRLSEAHRITVKAVIDRNEAQTQLAAETARADALALEIHEQRGRIAALNGEWADGDDASIDDAVTALLAGIKAPIGERGRELVRLLEPIDEEGYYACQGCGRIDGLDAVVPDAVWEQIREGLNILCLWCIDRRCKVAGISVTAALHFAGLAVTGSSQSDADREQITRACSERDALAGEVARLTAALEFYADRDNYDLRPFREGLGGLSLVDADTGARARAALEAGGE